MARARLLTLKALWLLTLKARLLTLKALWFLSSALPSAVGLTLTGSRYK